MKLPQVRRKYIAVLLSAAIGTAAAWFALRPSATLLERAQPVATIWLYTVPQPYRWVNDEEVLYRDRDGKVMLCRRSTGEACPDSRSVEKRSWMEPMPLPVRPPSNWQRSLVTDADWSPCGDRIAFTIEGVPPRLYPEFIYSLLPSLKKPERTEALCVCNLDGSDIRELGRLTEDDRFAMSDGPKYSLTHMQWLPGGRSVSFLHGDTLYVVDP